MCCGNNGWGGCGCLWIIILIIILLCCCGGCGERVRLRQRLRVRQQLRLWLLSGIHRTGDGAKPRPSV